MNKAERVAYIREAFPNMSDEDKLEIAVFLVESMDGHSP
jgi:hypothetical protein